jgi:hypothetical protein
LLEYPSLDEDRLHTDFEMIGFTIHRRQSQREGQELVDSIALRRCEWKRGSKQRGI